MADMNNAGSGQANTNSGDQQKNSGNQQQGQQGQQGQQQQGQQGQQGQQQQGQQQQGQQQQGQQQQGQQDPPPSTVLTDDKGGQQQQTEVVPEKYADFKVPEGFEIQAPMLEKFQGLAKEMKLSQEKAQKLVDLASEQAKGILEAQTKAFQNEREEWKRDLKDDKDYGRGAYANTLERAKRVYRNFGNEFGVKEVLDESGLGDHKGLIIMLAKIDKALGEDYFVDGNRSSGGNQSDNPAEKLFGKDGQGPKKQS